MIPKTKAEWLSEAKRIYDVAVEYDDHAMSLAAAEAFTRAGAAAAISAAIPNTQPGRKRTAAK